MVLSASRILNHMHAVDGSSMDYILWMFKPWFYVKTAILDIFEPGIGFQCMSKSGNLPFMFLMFSFVMLASERIIILALELSIDCFIIGKPGKDDCKCKLALFQIAILW